MIPRKNSTSIYDMTSKELEYLKMIRDGLIGLCDLKWNIKTIQSYVHNILEAESYRV